jgi:hypothetical protein
VSRTRNPWLLVALTCCVEIHVSVSVLTAGLAVQIVAFGAAPGMGMYPAGGGGRLGDAGPGGGIELRRRGHTRAWS